MKLTTVFNARLFALSLLALTFVPLTMSSPALATTGTLFITLDSTLTEDHVGDIVVAANGVTLDCDNHTVTGPGSGTGILLNERTGVTVKNCNVSGFTDGFVLRDSFENTLEGNTADDNDGVGILLDNSSGNLIGGSAPGEGNTANLNAVPTEDFPERCCGSGIRLFNGSNNNTLTNNTANGNHQGIGVFDSNNNTLTGNTANNNRFIGFHLRVNSGNVLYSNTASGNGAGFSLVDSNSNSLSRNTFNGNTSQGIQMVRSSNNTLQVNTVSDNGLFGINVTNTGDTKEGFLTGPADGNTFEDNLVAGNGSVGMIFQGANNNTLQGNAVEGNGDGILLIDSNGNTLKRNRATNNNEGGFRLDSSNGNILLGNTANNNRFGIMLSSANGNKLVRNTANNNEAGFFLFKSNENILVRNNACDNPTFDAGQTESTGNIFVRNDFCTTSGIP